MLLIIRGGLLPGATLCLLLALSGCGGGSVTPSAAPAAGTAPHLASAAWPQALPLDRAQPWERLDAQGRVTVQPRAYFPRTRAGSSLNAQSEFLPGIERDSAGGTVADLGEAARLDSGAAGGRVVSYAMYRFPLGADQPGAVAADVNLRLRNSAADLSSYWLGLSDYTTGRWEWHGPYSDSHVRLSTGAAASAGRNYLSPLGSLYVCVLGYDGASFDIVGVGANTIDATDTTPPPAPTVMVAVAITGGLSLQWNSVVAADLAGYRIYWRQAAFSDPHSPGVSQVNYLEGATRHVLQLPNTATHSVAVAAVDLSGNESPASPLASAAPLAGSPPALQVSIDNASVLLLGAAQLTATGAASYDFDLDGDGTFDETNSSGLASVDTSATGLLRPLVRGTAGGSMEALGGVSLIVMGNTRPVASALATPQNGIAPLTVTFTGEAQDLEDAPDGLSYAWDFNDDGVYNPGTDTLAPNPYTYNQAGLWNVKLRVTDSQGAWDVDSITVSAAPKTGSDSTVVVPNDVHFRFSATLVGGLVAIAYQTESLPRTIYYIRATRPDASAWGAPVFVGLEPAPVDSMSMIVVNGNPAILYNTTANNYDLYYVRATTPQGTAWGAPLTIDASTDRIGGWAELVIAAGNPAIGYYNYTANQPCFVRSIDADGAAWTAPVLFGAPGTGRYCSTAIINGNPAMAYSDGALALTYYCRATDAAGSAWGAPVTILNTDSCVSTDLQFIGGRPCVALGAYTAGLVYYARAFDAEGADGYWPTPSIAVKKTYGTMLFPDASLAEVGGRPFIAVTDSSDYVFLAALATDPTGLYWGEPEVIAPFAIGDMATAKPYLLPLSGAMGIVHRTYKSILPGRQLHITRKYD